MSKQTQSLSGEQGRGGVQHARGVCLAGARSHRELGMPRGTRAFPVQWQALQDRQALTWGSTQALRH